MMSLPKYLGWGRKILLPILRDQNDTQDNIEESEYTNVFSQRHLSSP